MTNAELLAKIKAEIERRITDNTFGAKLELIDILAWLDTLEPEKPMQEELEEEIDRFEDWMETYNQADYPTSFTTRDIARHFAQWGEHNALEHLRAARRTEEAYQEVAKEMREQIEDGEELEKEIERYFPESAFDTGWNYDDMQEVARHFYDLGCRRTAEKYDEIEYNRQRASGSSEIPKDLAIAAESFAFGSLDEVVLYGCTLSGRRACFIAGAKWQADHAPLPEDTVLFNKGVEEGKRLMMEEAVEADVNIYRDIVAGKSWAEFVVEMPTNNLGEKVRVIVIPNTDEK